VTCIMSDLTLLHGANINIRPLPQKLTRLTEILADRSVNREAREGCLQSVSTDLRGDGLVLQVVAAPLDETCVVSKLMR
jgi:hypothetical protein